MFDQVLDPERCILEVYYEDVLENWSILQDLPMRFKRFANLEGYAMWLALRETKYFMNFENLTYTNSDDTVACVNHGGVCKLPIKLIKEMNTKIQPEAIISPVDHFVLPGTEKRRTKSRSRTDKYLKSLSELDNLVPSSVNSIRESPILAISGVSKLEPFLGEQRETAKYIRGSSLPFDDAIELVKRGDLDFFDTSYLLEQSEKGFALNLPTNDFDPLQLERMEWMNMNDTKYEADTSVLCAGCPCPGCQFMKSYIHHLFHVHEMLGPAALTAHNLYQIRRFLSLIP